MELTTERIDKLIKRRNKLTDRRDERINRPAVAEIDAQLAQVAPGENETVDRFLGRKCAQLTPRPDYGLTAALLASDLPADVEAVADERAVWIQQGLANGAALAATLTDEHAGWFVNPAARLWGEYDWSKVKDQAIDYAAFNGINEADAIIEETPKDWRDMRGDLDI